MIPKVIHYIWFGGKAKPNKIVQQIEQWRSILPDYQIKEWNETNYDIKNINVKYVQEALQENMWAFVSDYVRLDILNREGGIYLDTDVEILKSFDELLKNKAFIGRESKYAFSTAVIASEPKQRWLQQLLEDYSRRTFLIDKNVYDKTPNSKYILSFFIKNYNFNNLENQQLVNGVMIYPSTYFSPINFATHKTNISKETLTIHHYSGTWKSNSAKLKDMILIALTRLFGEAIIERIKKIKKYF
ncbi:glycosyltransferase family 32 protein [Leuconostoc fallax]|uniref:Glycosyl transferase n=1 Tax=Leuconostoc fallax TaxID=1251 RepID=A0A4R5NAC5_9LACO|nr:glycosyltransferase [Leuconostoc fallax]MBU7454889.1 glycosyltransferase [Leuconostoc fallax]TDG69453.1 hypothetical protein C5L23_000915 [Leuconostoc fallax]